MEMALEETSAKLAPAKTAHSDAPGRQWRILLWCFAMLVCATAIYYGLGMRRAAWEATTDIHFRNSVSNAIEWGRFANTQGVYNLYDELIEQHGPEGSYKGPARFALDYAPLRLLIAAKWAQWASEKYPSANGAPVVWRPEYDFTRPMLELNTACELLAMLGMFLLVYHWIRVCHTPPPEKWWSTSLRQHWGRDEASTRHLASTVGLFPATLAALLIWFNPAVLFNAHIYPQWDVWLLPAFIFAMYFGLRNWWLPAGIVVGICAMAKGQILFALPLLILWPLLLGHLAGAARAAIGVVVGVALVAWPWVLKSSEAWNWMLYVGIAAILLAVVAALPRSNWKWHVARGAMVLAAITLALWPVANITGRYVSTAGLIELDRRQTLLTVLSIAAVIAIIGGRKWVPTILVGFPAVCAILTIPLLKSSSAWFEIGTVFPTRNWKQLFWCHGANLGSILQAKFQWKYDDLADMSWIPFLSEPVPIRHVMVGIFVLLLAFCIGGFVRHRRRHDPRLLLAMAVPLMLAYAFLPQMIERYLIWPAALLSAYAAISIGGLVLCAAVSLLGVALMAGYILPFVRESPITLQWLPYIGPIFPDIGWAVIVLAIVMLYMGCTPSGRRPLWQKHLAESRVNDE